jgi:hypothetical protein
MGKVVIRLTESELKKIINESVSRILKEGDDSFILQTIAQEVAQNGVIYAKNGENETEVELDGGRLVIITFNVESDPYIEPGMKSMDYDVPNDPDEIIDKPTVTVTSMELYDNEGSSLGNLQDNGIVAKAIENELEMEYDSYIPSREEHFNDY